MQTQNEFEQQCDAARKAARFVMELGDWLEYGLPAELYRHKAMVRRWLREARGHKPVIDRWSVGQ